MTCPICGAPTERAYRPFCSRRCADVDLARWMNGSYAIPAGEADDPDDADLAAETPASGVPGDGRRDRP